MENDQNLPNRFSERAELVLPEFGSRPAVYLDISKIREGEARIIEAKAVNGGTYNELEYTFNEGWRECRKHLTVIGYEITRANKALRDAQSEALIDRYSNFLKEKKLEDSKHMKEAFLQTQEDYVKAQDRIDMLIAMESLVEGKLKVFEKVCQYMRKEIDIQNRSGYTGDKYLT